MKKGDIGSPADIQFLVDYFYSKVKENQMLRPIFEEVANIDWVHHLAKMYSFWNGVILGIPGYSGNPMSKHFMLNQKTILCQSEFDEWTKLFQNAVDELFEGPMADTAKQKASQIANLMMHKLNSSIELPNVPTINEFK